MRPLALALLFCCFSGAALAEKVSVSVDGMVCAFCAKGIENSFKKMTGVNDVVVDLDNKLVTLTTASNVTLSDAVITETMTAAGFATTNISRKAE